jgi:amidophosphoribosyltransferase
VFGESVNETRTEFGRRLASESGVPADVIVPIPDSGVCAAIGYSEASGIPMRMGLIRNHYVGRTFIEPQQSIRHFGVRVKLNPVRSILDGKRVVLVDDSIVRGNHEPKDREDGARRGRARSAHADQLSADDLRRASTAWTRRSARDDCRNSFARRNRKYPERRTASPI